MAQQPQVRSALFPVVGRDGVVFESVHVERLEALDRRERFAVAPGLGDVIEILMDSRTGDAAGRRLDGVSVVASGKGFGGKSYGLALAIADERARSPGSPSGAVIATGRVIERGRGAIGEVEGFEAKAEAAIAFAADRAEPVDFAFPEANWSSAEARLRERLQEAQRSGKLRLHRCERIQDSAALWRVRSSGKWRVPAAAVAALLIAGGSGAAYYGWRSSDARACEARTAALGETPAGDAIAEAVRACRNASERSSGDGRLHRLYADTLALNGSPALAGAEWRKAAEAGDAEGAAAYGRFLWQSDPEDRTNVAAALAWLKRGAANGSAHAARDVGYVLLDGSAFPADPAEAQRWMRKAQQLQADSSGEEETKP